jgi:hypothetical protein
VTLPVAISRAANGCRAVPDVVIGDLLWQAGPERQDRRGPVQGLATRGSEDQRRRAREVNRCGRVR